MKTYLLVSLSVLLLFSCGNKKSSENVVPVEGKVVVNLILDTDLGPDYDDVGAIALNSWDQTAVLVAIKGYEPYYSTERGTVSVDDNGANTWSPSENGTHIRLIEQMPPTRVASLIESYMMHQPAAK
jgi:hypothetical protein